VKTMIEQEQWTSLRPVLLDLQRLNPQNTEVKKLLREVQEKVSRQQKSVQFQQLLGDAEEAVLTSAMPRLLSSTIRLPDWSGRVLNFLKKSSMFAH